MARKSRGRESVWPSANASWSGIMGESGWNRNWAAARLSFSHCRRMPPVSRSLQMKQGKIRILLIEDNPADVDLLLRAFKSAELEYDLMVYEDGAEAMALIRRVETGQGGSVPDLVVLD